MSYLLSALTADEADTVLSTAYRSLRPGGLLVVHDFMLDDEGAGPTATALWFLQYLAWQPDAWAFTGAELGERLGRAGFTPRAGGGRARHHEGRTGPQRRRRMNVGVGVTPMETRREVVLRVADLAEELGFTAFHVAEGWGYDAGVLLAEIATRTSRIELGTGVLNVWGRSPASIAMLAAGLAEVSGGRFTLGLGAGSPQLAEGLHDVPFRAPVRRLGAVARQVRALLDGERLTPSNGGAGPAAGGPGPRATAPGRARARRRAPRGEGRRRLVAVPAAAVRVEGADVPAGGGRGAGGRPRPQVMPGIPTALSPDVAAWWVAFYLTSMGPLYATTLREQGFGAAVDAVVAANGRGVPPTVPPAAQVLVDELLLTGREGLDRWRAAGADMPIVVLPPGRPVERAGGHSAHLPSVIARAGRSR